MKTLILTLSTILAVALAGCGGGGGADADLGVNTPDLGGGDQGVTGDQGGADTTAPQLVLATPADGANGQLADVQVVLQFDEPMDQASVLAALDASDLGAVTLTWNAAGDTLTITPDVALAYAGGNHPAMFDALSYSVSLAPSARDLAGNPMSTNASAVLSTTFETLRRVNITLDFVADWSKSITPSTIEFAANPVFYVGDLGNDIALRTVLTFDISTLPAGLHSIDSALLRLGLLSGSQGNPFVDLDDSVLLDHVTYGELVDDNAYNAAFNSTSASTLVGVLYMDDQEGYPEVDVTSALAADVSARAARSDRSQYLARFETFTNQDMGADTWSWFRMNTDLDVYYLIP